METNRTYHVFINGEPAGTIDAPSWKEAKRLAKALHRVSCDII